jgi:hypothetical protein
MPNALENATGWTTQDAATGQQIGGGTFAPRDPLADVPYAPPDIGNTDLNANLQRQAIRNLELERRWGEIQEQGAKQRQETDQANIAAMQADRDKMARVAGHTGVNPDDLKPWDEKSETAKYTTPPLEQFGSWGMVFAMLASAFTHAPITSALNAGAAAMKAIQDGDEKRYQRAYAAWKGNTELVLKRHQIEREKWEDVLELFKTDTALGQARALAVATSLGDQQAIFLAQNGLHPELSKMLDDRDKAAVGLADSMQKIDENRPIAEANLRIAAAQRQLEQLRHKPNLRPEELKAAQDKLNRLVQYKQQLEQSRMPNATTNLRTIEADRLYREYDDALQRGDVDAMKRITQEMLGLHEAFDPWRQGSTTGEPKTAAGMQAAEIKRRQQEYVQEKTEEFKKKNGRDPNEQEISRIESKAFDQATKEVKTDQAVMTGNRKDQLQAHVQSLEENIRKIDESIDILQKHGWVSGLAGKIGRPVEAVGNILGKNTTERGQFESNISFLQTQGRSLFGEGGKGGVVPVSEQQKIDKVVRGLSMGDTADRTVRALSELKAMYEQAIRDTGARLSGGETPSVGPFDPEYYRGTESPATSPATHSEDKWWEAYPLAK